MKSNDHLCHLYNFFKKTIMPGFEVDLFMAIIPLLKIGKSFQQTSRFTIKFRVTVSAN